MIPSSFFDEMKKLAADEKKSPSKDIAKIVGMGLLGTGVGAGAGYLTAELLHRAGVPQSKFRMALPMLGTAAGLAYSVHKANEMEGIRRAQQDQASHSPG